MQNNLPTLFIAIAFNLFALNLSIQAQTGFGAISGTVTDAETGETLPFVNVAIEANGKLVGATTDFDGVYVIDYIPEGVYAVEFYYVGYQTKKIEGVVVTKGDTTLLDVKLSSSPEAITPLYCPGYHNPPLLSSDTRSGITIRQNNRGHFDVSNIR